MWLDVFSSFRNAGLLSGMPCPGCQCGCVLDAHYCAILFLLCADVDQVMSRRSLRRWWFLLHHHVSLRSGSTFVCAVIDCTALSGGRCTLGLLVSLAFRHLDTSRMYPSQILSHVGCAKGVSSLPDCWKGEWSHLCLTSLLTHSTVLRACSSV
jgi:hypothetical protein